MLKKIGFSEEDNLIILGDVIDRGPDGIALLLEIMDMPNVIMLLGNHEYMMLQYLNPSATGTEIRRWNKNGNAPTLAAYLKQKAKVQQRIISYLRGLPTHLEMEINGKWFYLVHGFPGENVHDEVWHRPEIDTANPKPGYQVVIGHTKVLSMIKPEEARIRYAVELEDKGEYLRILHTSGFINIDCGCGYDMPIKALACLRLEDLSEFYA
jgi:serine/threonine protein phosphatase 1